MKVHEGHSQYLAVPYPRDLFHGVSNKILLPEPTGEMAKCPFWNRSPTDNISSNVQAFNLPTQHDFQYIAPLDKLYTGKIIVKYNSENEMDG